MNSPRELITNHLDIDLLTHLEPKVADKVLVNPRLKLAHPTARSALDCPISGNDGIFLVLLYVPERGLSFISLLRNRRRRLARSRTLEWSGGRVCLAGHGGVSGRRSAGSSGRRVSHRVLALEIVEVLERHVD